MTSGAVHSFVHSVTFSNFTLEHKIKRTSLSPPSSCIALLGPLSPPTDLGGCSSTLSPCCVVYLQAALQCDAPTPTQFMDLFSKIKNNLLLLIRKSIYFHGWKN
jgi:hypothetical protein